MPTAIFCGTCGATGTVAKVTPGLTCRCGSRDLGLDGVDPKPSHVLQTRTAAPQGPGTGWAKPMPDPTAGWDQYVGPPAHPNPYPVRDANPWQRCPDCEGTGYDLVDKSPCRTCHGSGAYTPTTSRPADDVHPQQWDHHPRPPAGGAGWRGAAQQVTVPGPVRPSPGSRVSTPAPERPKPVRARSATAAGQRQDLPGVTCPQCRQTTTSHLASDLANHAWWCCTRCGALADLDRTPELDPYTPDPDRPFMRQKGYRTKASKLRKSPARDGRLFTVMAAVEGANRLSRQETLTLARNTVAKYPG